MSDFDCVLTSDVDVPLERNFFGWVCILMVNYTYKVIFII